MPKKPKKKLGFMCPQCKRTGKIGYFKSITKRNYYICRFCALREVLREYYACLIENKYPVKNEEKETD